MFCGMCQEKCAVRRKNRHSLSAVAEGHGGFLHFFAKTVDGEIILRYNEQKSGCGICGCSAKKDRSDMMFCPNCGNTIADDAVFCGFCGTTLTSESSASGFFSAPSTLTGKEEAYATPRADVPTEYVPTEKPKNKKKILIISIIAAVVVIAAVLTVVLVLNSSAGPLDGFLSLVQNTVDAGSFTAEVKYYRDGDLKNRMDIGAEYDFDAGELTLVCINDSDNEIGAIYDGYSIEFYSDEYYGYKHDISDELDLIFEYYEKIKLEDLSDADLEDLLEELDLPKKTVRQIEPYIDLEEAQDAFETVIGWLNDEDWLEEHLNLEVSEKKGITTYSFEIDGKAMREIGKSALKEFESALDDDIYDEIEDSLRDIDKDWEITLEVSTDGTYLTEVEISFDTGYHTERYVISFDDYGSTEVDTDDLDYWLRRAD